MGFGESSAGGPLRGRLGWIRLLVSVFSASADAEMASSGEAVNIGSSGSVSDKNVVG